LCGIVVITGPFRRLVDAASTLGPEQARLLRRALLALPTTSRRGRRLRAELSRYGRRL